MENMNVKYTKAEHLEDMLVSMRSLKSGIRRARSEGNEALEMKLTMDLSQMIGLLEESAQELIDAVNYEAQLEFLKKAA